MKITWPWARKANEDGAVRTSADLMSLLFGGRQAKSGASVNNTSALEVTAVLACVRVIAEGVAQVPLKLFREAGKEFAPAVDHSLYRLLHRKPNPWMSSFELRETMAIHAALTGNAVSYVSRMPGSGRILEIVPIRPNDVEIKRGADGMPIYIVTGTDGSRRDIPRAAIWHWRGPSWDGIAGLEIIKYAREAIGLAMVTEEAHAGMHKNGARTTGLYSVEGTLNAEQYKGLREWIEKSYAGAANAGRVMLMDRNAKFFPQSMTGIDAQHLETRRYQVEEICRAFRVQPIMAGYSDKAATYASVEQMLIAHVVHTLAPWYERVEQSIDCQLLSEKELDQGYYAKFIAEGLMRGAFKDTAESLVKLSTNGVLTRNEARAKLEYNPLPGLDEPLTPANMTIGAMPEPVPDAVPDTDTAKALAALAIDIKALGEQDPAAAPPQQLHVTLNQEPITINVPAQKAGDVHLTLPEQRAAEVHVTLPEQKAPDVHVTVEAPAIDVKVEPPAVTLEAVLPQPQVIVSMPNRKTVGTIERDSLGNIVRTTQVESDA